VLQAGPLGTAQMVGYSYHNVQTNVYDFYNCFGFLLRSKDYGSGINYGSGRKTRDEQRAAILLHNKML
jgi:hypothetical protein